MRLTRRQAMLGWVLGSAVLMVLGAFGPWVKALGQSVAGTDGGNDGWFVVAAAAVAAALFYRLREVPAAGIWPLIGGVIGAFVTLYDRNNVQDAIDEGGAFVRALAQVGWGLNLAIVASVSFAVAGAVWWRKYDDIFPVAPLADPPGSHDALAAPSATAPAAAESDHAVTPAMPGPTAPPEQPATELRT